MVAVCQVSRGHAPGAQGDSRALCARLVGGDHVGLDMRVLVPLLGKVAGEVSGLAANGRAHQFNHVVQPCGQHSAPVHACLRVSRSQAWGRTA